MCAHTRRIEVITRTEKRRRWSVEEKQAIVAESLAGRASIAAIARKHGIGTGQLYIWRHQLRRQRPASACFAQVAVMADGDPSPAAGRIEIVLPNAIMLRVDGGVDAAALRRVLSVLGG